MAGFRTFLLQNSPAGIIVFSHVRYERTFLFVKLYHHYTPKDMKRIFIMTLALLMFVNLSACNDSKKTIAFDQLPQTAQTFVNTHFADKQVSVVFIETSGRDEYEVLFADGASIDFTSNGDWEEAKDRDADGLPTHFMPTSMVAYVATTFPGTSIVKVSKERSKFDVELSNGVELEFDKAGNFLRFDD